MRYRPTIWQTGDIITAQKLNKIENAIHSILSEYEQTNWVDGEIITAEKLNKIEDAIEYINLDYIKTVWKNNDIITASLLNNIENGIEIASVDKTWEEMTWDDVIAATKNGKYKNFEVGAMKELDLGTEGIVHMQIVGIDADELADGSGKAPLSFVVKKLLVTKHRVNPVLAPASPPHNVGTGMVGGWENSDVRAYLNEVIWPLIPQSIRDAIKTVIKYSTSYDTAGQKVNDAVTYDKLWIPSSREIHGEEGIETRGPVYSDVFSGLESRLKYRQEGGDAATWWLRTGYNEEKACYTTQKGYLWQWKTSDNDNIAIGFCL